MIQLPGDVWTILKTLNEHGFEACIVGGCVRDYLLAQTPKDFDIATSASPEEVKRHFRKTVDTGIRHGTVSVLLRGRAYEVTTYRIDGAYEDCRRPETVIFTRNLREDLERRDFTINAIAYHPDMGFADPFAGKEDIEKKIIRGVGEPVKRFREDALRMLRAVRFSCALGFVIEEETFAAIQKSAHLIAKISKERIRDELIKICIADYVQNMRLLGDTGLLKFIFPSYAEILQRNMATITKEIMMAPKDSVIAVALFMRHIEEKDLPPLLRDLRLDNKSIKEIYTLAVEMKKEILPDPIYIRKKISQIGFDLFLKLLAVKEAKGKDITAYRAIYDDIVRKGDCVFLKDLQVSGSDLLEMGFKKGKKIGDILQYLLDYVHQFPEQNNKENLLTKAEDFK